MSIVKHLDEEVRIPPIDDRRKDEDIMARKKRHKPKGHKKGCRCVVCRRR